MRALSRSFALSVLAAIIIVIAHDSSQAQFRGTLDLQGTYSNNVEGTDSSSPDNILQPLIDLLYKVPIKSTDISVRARYQPQYFFREVKRSFHYGYLSLGSVTSFTEQTNSLKPEKTDVITDANTARISRLLTDEQTVLANILSSADISQIASTLAALRELLIVERFSETFKEILIEELEAIERSSAITTNVAARTSVESLMSKIDAIDASEDILYMGGAPLQTTGGERKQPTQSPALLIIPDDIAYQGITHSHLYLLDDLSPLSAPTNDPQLSVLLSGEFQENAPKYRAYSSQTFSFESGYTTHLSDALIGVQYAYQHVYYPDDTLFQYSEHRIYGDLRYPLSDRIVWISSLGYGVRSYPHPLRVQPLPRRILTSQSEFSQFSLGTGLFLLPTHTLTLGILGKLTINTNIDSTALSFNTTQVASYAGTTIYNTYAYDLQGAILTFGLRLPFDINLGATVDYEYRRYPDFRVPKLQGGGTEIQTRNDNVSTLSSTISRPFYQQSDRIVGLFTAVTPSVDILLTEHRSSLSSFSYQELALVCTLSFDF